MTNIRLPIGAYEDIETKNLFAERLAQGRPQAEVLASVYARSRDNARTPMQWSAEENAGFTTGTPWFTVNPNYTEINAQAALADPDSIFYHYQKLIALRKAHPVFRDGTFTLLDPEDEKVFAYVRETDTERLLAVGNFTGETVPWSAPAGFEGAETLISNCPAPETGVLRPYEAFLLYKRLG